MPAIRQFTTGVLVNVTVDNPTAVNMRHYTSAAAFLLMAIALVVPSGYSLGAVMLLLGSVALLFLPKGSALERRDWWIVAVLIAIAAVWIAEAWWDGQGTRGMDKPIRFLLAVPVLMLLLAYPPRAGALWAGLAVGGLLTGSWATWQKAALDVERASGYTYVIQYGNISMLTGILCLAGMGWAVKQPRRGMWLALLLLGCVGGVLGSLLSGTRGGWIGIPVVLWVLYRGYGRDLPYRWKASALSALLIIGALAYAVPQAGVQARVNEAVNDVYLYFAEDYRLTSVGARFDMWQGASRLIVQKPVFGWGSNGYREGMEALAERGVIDPITAQFGHAHNDFIDAAAKRGIFGLLAVLALYLIPIRLFAHQLNASDLELRSLAVAGVLLPVAYFDFGLSQVFLAHNSGVMVYAFLLPVIWALFRHAEQAQMQEATHLPPK
ncbi:O-antigen ligase family protein [Billgrantia desiderata]|uniref:O-antigen ligase family protein n=1 Tax=Billgrantia desiderata TaxID=52021 RepID=UPI0020CD0A82|nr:O-antigen ligase [Halomonas desiderata]